MHPWSILLLPLTFLMTYLTLLGFEGADPGDAEAWRRAFVKTALLCGAWVTISTEVLSLVHALTGSGLTLFWALGLLVAAVASWRTGSVASARRWLRAGSWHLSLAEAGLLLAFAVILLLTGAVAWVSPPNTTDSHLYHMSRVMHWAQAGTLAHYPTTYEHQLWFPPWAETAILTLRLLWGTDQPAALVQGLSYLGCLIVAAGVAGFLGADRGGQLLAAAFCASIPMAILQASSTQNDLVSGFWLLSLAYLLTQSAQRTTQEPGAHFSGLALGLGMLTKSTFYLYAAPFVAWYLWRVLRSGGALAGAKMLAVAGMVAAALNSGFWARNWVTYGGPLGPMELVRAHTALGAPGTLRASWAAHLVSHFATPSEPLNRTIEAAFGRLCDVVRGDLPDFGLIWSWNHEDLAGSPLHLASIGFVVVLVLVVRGRRSHGSLVPYTAAGVVAFALLTVLVNWNPYVVRLHLPFLMVMAPVIGVAFGSWLRPGRVTLLGVLFVALSLPWVLLNQTRPVIGLRPRTAIVSVFRAEKVDILFANWLPQRDDFIAAAATVRETGCMQIGLRIDSHDLEYPHWWLLGAPQNGMRLEHVEPYPHLERYVDPGFRPCAILCTTCGGRGYLHGLERIAGFGEIVVFAGDGYRPEQGAGSDRQGFGESPSPSSWSLRSATGHRYQSTHEQVGRPLACAIGCCARRITPWDLMAGTKLEVG